MKTRQPAPVECVKDDKRAAILMRPLRREILRRCENPCSSAEIAVGLGLPRQKVNYHVRELASAGFLLKAGRRLKRNLVEQRYVASARSYVLSPEVVSPLSADRLRPADRLSAGYLLALAAQTQKDVGEVMQGAEEAGQRLATLSFSCELGFESPQQRSDFMAALEEALAVVIGRHSTALPLPEAPGTAGDTDVRPYRLMLGCYPRPAD